MIFEYNGGIFPQKLHDISFLWGNFPINYLKEAKTISNIIFLPNEEKSNVTVGFSKKEFKNHKGVSGLKYYEDFSVLYFLNKDIKLANKGACGDAIDNPTEIQDKIWGKRLIDIKKITKFWE